MSKIKTITISNLKAISEFTADFKGMTAIVTAGNNQGKSTLLRTPIDRIRGVKPDMVLKQNEKEGFSEIELTTGEKFVWTFNEKGKEKLTFVSERNIPGSVSRDLANAYFPAVFDVDAFLSAAPKKQKDTLQKISGIDFTEFDKQYKEAYDNRTYCNRMYDQEKAKAEYIDPKLPDEPLLTDKIEAELNGIEAHNLRNKQVVDGITMKKAAIADNEAEIAELAAKIAQLQERNEALETEIEKGNAWLSQPNNAVKSNAEELGATLAEIREQNKTIEANNKAKQQQAKIEAAEKSAKEADAEVKRLEAEKLEVIKNASMPEGFSFTDDGISYNGFPFDKQSLSSSQVYIGALKLAATTLGQVKALYFDASFLDKKSLQEVEAWAKGEGLQLLIERPSFEGGPLTYEIINEG